MKKDQSASLRNLVEAGIELKVGRRIGVKLRLPCPKLEKRLIDVLLLVKMGPGQVHCTVTQHYPKVLDIHPWIKAKYNPAANTYHLTIRSELEVFECVLQTQVNQCTSEVIAAFEAMVPEICENGWFGKKKTAKAEVLANKPPKPSAFVSLKSITQTPAQVGTAIHRRPPIPLQDLKEAPANLLHFAWGQSAVQAAEEPEADKPQAKPRHVSLVLTGRRKLIKDILELLHGFDVQKKGLEKNIAELEAKKRYLTETRDSLLVKLESLKKLEKLAKKTSEQPA